MQRAAHNFFIGPLANTTDFYNFREILDFMGQNGLTHNLDVSISSMVTHFLLDEEFFDQEDFLASMDEDNCRWTARLELWLNEITLGWRNRRIITSTLTSLIAAKIKQQSMSPLLGSKPPKLEEGLTRALKLAGLSPEECFNNSPELKFLFVMANPCTAEFFNTTNIYHPRARWLIAFDACSDLYQCPVAQEASDNKHFDVTVKRAATCVRLMDESKMQPEIVEGHFFLRLAQAYSSFQFERYYDCLAHLLNLLCDFEEVKVIVSQLTSSVSKKVLDKAGKVDFVKKTTIMLVLLTENWRNKDWPFTKRNCWKWCPVCICF